RDTPWQFRDVGSIDRIIVCGGAAALLAATSFWAHGLAGRCEGPGGRAGAEVAARPAWAPMDRRGSGARGRSLAFRIGSTVYRVDWGGANAVLDRLAHSIGETSHTSSGPSYC